MKFVTHNDKDIQIGGTCGRGSITCDYKTLVHTFGAPGTNFDDFKSDAEWDIEFENGVIATIYNWKNGINYCGLEDGTPTELITDWNVGGNSPTCPELIQECIYEATHKV
jgi:hypothetical protein